MTQEEHGTSHDGSIPPPLTDQDRDDIRELIAERSAIQEFDGGLPRAVAEQKARDAMRVYRVLLAMPPDESLIWRLVFAPGCDRMDVERMAIDRYGAERVISVAEQARREGR